MFLLVQISFQRPREIHSRHAGKRAGCNGRQQQSGRIGGKSGGFRDCDGGEELSRNHVVIPATGHAWGEPVYIVLMLISVGLNYITGLQLGLERRPKARTNPCSGR